MSDLAKLERSATDRIKKLRTLIEATDITDAQRRRVIAYATIELDNLIVKTMGHFVKSSMLGARSSAGVRIKANIHCISPENAASMILKNLQPKKFKAPHYPLEINERDEVTLRQPSRARDAFVAFGLSNINSLDYAMTLNGRVFKEISTVRHYFCHRCEGTNAEVRDLSNKIGFLDFVDAEYLMLRLRDDTPDTVISGWLTDAEVFFEEALR